MARGFVQGPHVLKEERTERLLTRLATATDIAERDQIITDVVEENLGLCDALANRYAYRGADRDDLVQVARVALVLAIHRYRPADGRSFVAFAVPTITGELKRHFRDQCWVVRPPRRIQELRASARGQQRDLEQRLGRVPTSLEIGEAMGIDDDELRESLVSDGSFRPASLDAPVRSDGATLGQSVAQGDDAIERLSDHLTLRRLLRGLEPREQLIVSWRFEEGCTQSTIGARLGISQMQVSRLLRQILDRLGTSLSAAEAGVYTPRTA